MPDTGNQPIFTEKKMIRSGPSQKFGMDMPSKAKNMET